jgi:hypothetical protein
MPIANGHAHRLSLGLDESVDGDEIGVVRTRLLCRQRNNHKAQHNGGCRQRGERL